MREKEILKAATAVNPRLGLSGSEVGLKVVNSVLYPARGTVEVNEIVTSPMLVFGRTPRCPSVSILHVVA